MKKVRYSLVCYKSGTNEVIDFIKVGQDFDLAFNASDIRPTINNNLRGVFAAYTDILYNKKLVDVRAAEVQLITFNRSVRNGTFKLTVPSSVRTSTNIWNIFGKTKTTSAIQFDNRNLGGIIRTNQNIENALNDILGPGSVKVNVVSNGLTYAVKFIGFYDVDRTLMKSNVSNVTVKELIKGDTNLPASFLSGVTFSEFYTNMKTGADAPDRLDNLGAVFTGNLWWSGVGSDVTLEVARIRMLAKNMGSLPFTLDLTDVPRPTYETLVLGNVGANPPEGSKVLPEEIDLVNTWLTILK